MLTHRQSRYKKTVSWTSTRRWYLINYDKNSVILVLGWILFLKIAQLNNITIYNQIIIILWKYYGNKSIILDISNSSSKIRSSSSYPELVFICIDRTQTISINLLNTFYSFRTFRTKNTGFTSFDKWHGTNRIPPPLNFTVANLTLVIWSNQTRKTFSHSKLRISWLIKQTWMQVNK